MAGPRRSPQLGGRSKDQTRVDTHVVHGTTARDWLSTLLWCPAKVCAWRPCARSPKHCKPAHVRWDCEVCVWRPCARPPKHGKPAHVRWDCARGLHPRQVECSRVRMFRARGQLGCADVNGRSRSEAGVVSRVLI